MTVTTLRPEAAWASAGEPAKHWLRHVEFTAAIASAALLITMSALPSESQTPVGEHATTKRPSAFAGPIGREVTFGAYLGAPYHYPSDFRFQKNTTADFTLENVEWYTHPFDNPLYYGVRIQRWGSTGRTGAMLDFLHSKAYAPMEQSTKIEGTIDGKPVPDASRIGDLFHKLEFTHGHNMLTLNGLFRFANFSNVVVPYAGFGAGVSLPHSEMHRKGETARTYEYQYTGPAAQALAGLEIRLRTGSVFLEYKFTVADYRSPHTYRDGSLFPIDLWHQFSRWWSGDEPPGGWAETRLASHQVVGGFMVRFAAEGAATAAP